MSLIYMTELCDEGDEMVGWGPRIVIDGLTRAGHDVRTVSLHDAHTGERPDVWCVSLPYAGNVAHLARFWDLVGESPDRTQRSSGVLYLLGGHAVVNTDPLLDCFDAVYVGEVDDQIEAIGAALPDLDALAEIPGVDVAGEGDVWFQVAQGIGARGFYDAPGKDGVARTRYLEVAKGCRAGCRFCELGWLYGYQERSREDTEALMAAEDDPRAIVLSAPDTDGVSWLGPMMADGAYDPRWRSTRVVPYLRNPPVPPSGRRGRLRFGVEGVTERLRVLVGKKITNEQLEQGMQRAVDEGYRMLRLFLIAGLPGETAHDRRNGMREILAIPARLRGLRHWKSVDIKVTGLSAQPLTPMQRCGVGRAVEALAEYRALKRAMQGRDQWWRQVMPDRGDTEADVLKRLRRGELLPYLAARGESSGKGDHRWKKVRRWAMDAGIDYDSRVYDDAPLDAALPWARTRHPNERRVARSERNMWRAASSLPRQ